MKTGMLDMVAQKQSGKLEELHRSHIYKGDWLANWEQEFRIQSVYKQKLIVYKEFLFLSLSILLCENVFISALSLFTQFYALIKILYAFYTQCGCFLTF